MEFLSFYLLLSALLFGIGAVGVIVKRNAIAMFLCLELMINSVNLTFVTFARGWERMDGHLFVIFVMAVAAVEAAVGLALILAVFRNFVTSDTEQVANLRG